MLDRAVEHSLLESMDYAKGLKGWLLGQGYACRRRGPDRKTTCRRSGRSR